MLDAILDVMLGTLLDVKLNVVLDFMLDTTNYVSYHVKGCAICCDTSYAMPQMLVPSILGTSKLYPLHGYEEPYLGINVQNSIGVPIVAVQANEDSHRYNHDRDIV